MRYRVYLFIVWTALIVAVNGREADRTDVDHSSSLRGSVSAQGPQTPAFEPNLGQADPEVKFVSRSATFAALLTPTGATLAFSGPTGEMPLDYDSTVRTGTREERRQRGVVRLQLIDANPRPRIAGLRPLPSRTHYFVGNDPATWYTNVPNYGAVSYRGVYDGIDLIFYGRDRNFEYDFVLAPGADPRSIVLTFDGVDGARLDDEGNLILSTPAGDVVQRAPVCYQPNDDSRARLSRQCALRLQPTKTSSSFGDTRYDIRFDVSSYDASRTLVIDPVLAYSTYLGGAGSDLAQAVAVDASGNVYVTGETSSVNFPTTPGAFQVTGSGTDGFVTKYSPSGQLLYSTYVGGDSTDRGNGIALDAQGNAYIVGRTGSANFPTTPGAFRRFFGGDSFDAFAAKLNPNGSGLVYSTYLGAGGNDAAYAVAVDQTGAAFVAGGTNSSDFPVTPDAFQTGYGGGFPGNDAFVTKFTVDGSDLQYSTYLGGTFVDRANGLALDAAGNAYVTGWTESTDFPTESPLQPQKAGGRDAFVTKFVTDGSALVFSTFLGGAAEDAGLAIALGPSNSPHITGYSESFDFPTRNAQQPAIGGGRDAFVARLDAAGTSLVYSTYFGGADAENLVGSSAVVGAIAVDATGRAHVTGSSRSILRKPGQPGYGGGLDDAFVANFEATGALTFASFLGGSGSDVGIGIAVHPAGGTYIVGQTSSTNFPVVNAAQPAFGGATDAFVSRIDDTVSVSADLAVSKSAPVGPAAPGTDVPFSVEVTNRGPDTGMSATLSDAVPAGTTFRLLIAPVDWSCTHPAPGGTGLVRCIGGAIAAGSTASFTIVVRINDDVPDGTISNTATVGASTSDPDTENNSATATIQVGSSGPHFSGGRGAVSRD